MKRKNLHRSIVVLVLALSVVVVVAACSGGGEDSTATTSVAEAMSQQPATAADEMIGEDMLVGAGAVESLSTFRSKDPFIPQALPTETSVTTVTTTPGSGGATTSTTQSSGGTTTSYFITTTTKKPSTTTTAKPTTTTTAPHLHVLKVLSVSTVSSTPVVTFKVDSTVYKDKRAGDVVSTTWGQVKVVDIDTSSKVVTLLHGSETLILSVGQSTYE